jgi:hypothetical protein
VRTPRVIPKVAQNYSQKGMGHVDAFDARLSMFSHHKNVSWRRCHFLTMLKMSIMNAYVIYCHIAQARKDLQKGVNIPFRRFLEVLRDGMAEEWIQQKKKERDAKKAARNQNARERLRRFRARQKAASINRGEGHFRLNRAALFQ